MDKDLDINIQGFKERSIGMTRFLNETNLIEKIFKNHASSACRGLAICSDLPYPLRQQELSTKQTTKTRIPELNEQLNDVSLQPISKLLKLVVLY